MSTAALIQTIERLSPEEQRKVAMFILEISGQVVSEEPPSPANRGYGALAGKVWMSEDFDEPLEEFKDYM